MKNLYVKDLVKGLLIDNETFAVAEVTKGEDRLGKPYYNLVLSDKTGKIAAKIWSDKFSACDTKCLEVGVIISVCAKTEDFRGKIQLNISQLSKVDESVLDDFMQSSEFDSDEMMEELLSEVNNIKNSGIKKVLLNMFADPDFLNKFKYRAAGRSIHHDFKSGMLQHVLEMINASKGLRRFYPMVNFDILTAGIILHDLGKFEELESNGLGTNYTKKGSLLGHITLGVMIFERYGGKELPEDVYLHIVHLILSHHGETQFGSPVVPSTVEAIMLTYLDRLSSKARTAVTAVRDIPTDRDFGNPNMWLENARFWKGGKYDEEETSSEDSPVFSTEDTEDDVDPEELTF